MEPPQPNQQPQSAAPVRSAERPGPRSPSTFRVAALHLAPRAAGPSWGPSLTLTVAFVSAACSSRAAPSAGSEAPRISTHQQLRSQPRAPPSRLGSGAQRRSHKWCVRLRGYAPATRTRPVPSRRAGSCEAPPSEGVARPRGMLGADRVTAGWATGKMEAVAPQHLPIQIRR